MVRNVGAGRNEKSRWEDYFDSGERLLWQGAPGRGIRFSLGGLILSVFGLFFLSFSMVWVGMALQMSTGSAMDYLFPMFGMPFVLVGLWLVVGHWFFDAYKRKNTRYALTTKRALIARTLFGRRMESYEISATSPLTLVEGKSDTVNFAEKTVRGKNGTSQVPIGFRFISDGRQVYNMLEEIKRGEKS